LERNVTCSAVLRVEALARAVIELTYRFRQQIRHAGHWRQNANAAIRLSVIVVEGEDVLAPFRTPCFQRIGRHGAGRRPGGIERFGELARTAIEFRAIGRLIDAHTPDHYRRTVAVAPYHRFHIANSALLPACVADVLPARYLLP